MHILRHLGCSLHACKTANFYYSRLRVSENQIFAKSQMVYLVKEAQHVGMVLGLDSVRYYAIDIDIRNLSDYLVLKIQGLYELTRDLAKEPVNAGFS